MFAFSPQVEPNDWELNALGIEDGIHIYDNNPDYVYPPWALILLWPYRLMGATISRVLAGLVIGWLVYQQKWPLSLFFAIVISPFFVFSALFSNIDVLVTVLPILLWHTAEETEIRYQRWIYQTVAFALLLLKPQAGLLVIGYWLFTQRYEWRSLVVPLLIIGEKEVMPVSPPLTP